ncbi:MAG TPA: tripartite tricarboxylate transporter substrate binding protein [Burkholderiales bacterium]|nr:tripartite tricarboxylate transporter substrate binding protein [Burkholderiales bacterium]
MQGSITMLRAAAAALVCALASAAASAQTYPQKPVRMILPFPPGGPTDLIGRSVAQKLSEQMGQQVVTDNRPGAGGNIGLELAARSAPDGYTLVLSSPVVSISPALYTRLNYDPFTDLAPIGLVALIQNVVLVHPAVPVATLKELIQLARRNPGKLNFGSGGVGTTTHLAPELLMSMTRINMVHVPYKGTGQALLALVAGQIDMLTIAAPVAAPQVKAGKVRALAVLSAQRQAVLPGVPTAKEAGIDNYEVPVWYGLLAAAATPREIVGRVNQELNKALASADLKERLEAAGVEPMPSTPERFAAFIRSEAVRFAKVIKDAGIKGE